MDRHAAGWPAGGLQECLSVACGAGLPQRSHRCFRIEAQAAIRVR